MATRIKKVSKSIEENRGKWITFLIALATVWNTYLSTHVETKTEDRDKQWQEQVKHDRKALLDTILFELRQHRSHEH